ncbi:DUF262 domain-containing protein [Roseovarius aestuarii]|uniref:GmrSD restriction endonucleases N-terminal domain-containing protein n=1 Tax=Roseovarius aestuarii TaxID=475083 RepID=A0A1X7BKY4_9RHOB|nr:DUF262 domain-containing protein [Roseovarius aestuarii]SMC10312.1 hypothetical protein ROA7745_00118 [Roseovarius aestuarii]
MTNPLNADASSVGALFSNTTFEIPQYQREYSWQDDEVADFWQDLSKSLDVESYFLGLVILTNEEQRKHVVDGQQRIVTLTLLATALYFEAVHRGRSALADRIQAEFLKSIDYDTDETAPRVHLSDLQDNETLQFIIENGETPGNLIDEETVSFRIASSFKYLREKLAADLAPDPFKRLGKWAEFLTNRVYFAVFIHPDAATAYQVFEVINTRGKDLTTADLLKNFVLSQTAPNKRVKRYEQWRTMAKKFSPEGSSNTFVQFIRHSVTVENGHILPKDLFEFLAQRQKMQGKIPPTPDQLMELLQSQLPLYLQMVDPSSAGPASEENLKVFGALNALNVIAVRPILLATSPLENSQEGLENTLKLVVRRIVVGNLGTGNVERRLAEVAKKIHAGQDWSPLLADLRDLNPTRDEFVDKLRQRSLNKNTLSFLRRSIIQQSITPEPDGTLHHIWPRNNADGWDGMPNEEGAFWAATIGNTLLSELKRRPPQATENWEGFKQSMFGQACVGEWLNQLAEINDWTPNNVEQIGRDLAEAAAEIWY